MRARLAATGFRLFLDFSTFNLDHLVRCLNVDENSNMIPFALQLRKCRIVLFNQKCQGELCSVRVFCQ